MVALQMDGSHGVDIYRILLNSITTAITLIT